MKVRVLKSFVGHYEEDGQLKPISAGMNDVIELPEGVDWLRVGLVEPVKEEGPRSGPESAALEPAEKAMKPAAKKKTRRTRARSKK